MNEDRPMISLTVEQYDALMAQAWASPAGNQSKLADVVALGAAELKRLRAHADNMKEWANKFQKQRDEALDQRDQAMELAEAYKADRDSLLFQIGSAKIEALKEFEDLFLLHHREYAISPAQIMALRELRAKYDPIVRELRASGNPLIPDDPDEP